MQQAYDQALQARDAGEVPVGAVVVDCKTDNIITATYNLVEQQQNPSAHAEMLAITQATAKTDNKFLSDCDLYVTLEPCPMCAAAISLARFRRVYFGAYDPKSGGVEHGAKIFSASSCHHKPEIYGGIMESQCSKLLSDFFASKR